ncbi:protein NRT1/ PTR FAMILY 5.8-like [Magnolia sinica]|uniref:protein NRT1/ PTR FAMILY 5.8-like n=1 Tax=Magnolia sinica TaxID=86752 RepID=UPI0026595F0B|nr:protein NRT1/ PTR FAMILY 5.8-like [Magnolia sinica]
MDGGTGSTRLSKSCVLIIVVASIERFSYKGVASNLVTYLTDVVKMSTSSAAKSVNTWCGVTSMLPLAGAFLADSYWDRYSTILVSSLLYVVGLLALTSRALLWANTSSASSSSSSASLFCSLYLISLGQGGYNPCLQAFGADQLENVEDDELPCNNVKESTNKKTSFFQWWYFGICSGSLLGVSFMSYIQDTYGWGWGFAIPTIAMGASIVFFSCGSRSYVHKQSKIVEKPFDAIVHSIKEAVRKLLGGRISLLPRDSDGFELELQEKKALQVKIDGSKSSDMNPSSCELPFDGARAILRLLPIWAMLLTFAVIFQQPSTFFTKQGMTMKRNIGEDFMIPPATLQSAITISIILLMPLYDKIIIPIIRIFTRDDKGCNVLQRIGIGMFLSIIAMIIAAVVESKRLRISRKPDLLLSRTSTVPLSIFWLLPQYILLGISDVFTVVGMQEFFYTQVPNRMRTIGIALYLSVFGVGSFLSALLISVIELITSSSRQKHSWFSDDMREAHLDNYYWLLALLGTLSLFLFVNLSKHYNACKDSPNESGK